MDEYHPPLHFVYDIDITHSVSQTHGKRDIEKVEIGGLG
jgi:hypothetical protein